MNCKKILLVEDDKDVVRAMAVRLKSMGHNLVVAQDAISAISTARKEKPDLMVLDLGLPGGDGFTVMQRIKSNVDLMLIPIIVVSARDPLTNEQKALDAGAEIFLQKPFENEEFLAAIDRALSKNASV
jgi:two-component system KDP operon response regulator KdpE